METADEATAEGFCCLATVETAFKKSGDVNDIPGTCEYGSGRTEPLVIRTSKENE